MAVYTDLSYEETKRIIKQYFEVKGSFPIKFRLLLKDDDNNLDSPTNKNNGLEDKFLGL